MVEPRDQLQTLLAVYNENCQMARHHETQRATVTGMVAVAVGVLLGLAFKTNGGYGLTTAISTIPVAAFIFGLGLLGLKLSQKHYERSRLHVARIRTVRTLIQTLTQVELSEATAKADIAHEKDFPESYKTVDGKLERIPQLNSYWNAFHKGIMILATIIAAWSIGTVAWLTLTTFPTTTTSQPTTFSGTTQLHP